MKKNKTITLLIISTFFILLSFFYGGEYINHHKKNIEIKNHNNLVLSKAQNFKINDLKNIEDIELYYTPSKKVLEKIIDKINNAEKYIYIEIYMFSEKRIKEAVKKAHEKGIEVKILMEKNPYMTNNINNKFFNEFKNKGINIKWSEEKNYALNHSKMILIDGKAIISTGNLTYSTFTKNRDLFIFLNDKEINKIFLDIFNNDFEGIKKGFYHENIILSPTYSRSKIRELLSSAKNDVKIYIQYFNDKEIREDLISLKNKKNLNITAIIPESAKNDEEVKELIKSGINIKILKKYKMHSKAILVDNEILFIGSVNFSNYSFDKNREIGILTKNKKVINNFLDLFLSDLNN